MLFDKSFFQWNLKIENLIQGRLELWMIKLVRTKMLKLTAKPLVVPSEIEA